MYKNDSRVIMTLDAGGTNFVFSAMQGGNEIVTPVHLPSIPDNLELCLSQLVKGFTEVQKQLSVKPVAISFAFPGPADYMHGVIGDLPNFPAFKGGIALGPFLSEKFNMPVYINNDGNLYAYGEALFGMLPTVNETLAKNGSNRVYKNLIGLTLGTGFGCGVVIDQTLLTGDNGCGGDVWLMRNPFQQKLIIEENVSIRAIKRVYREESGINDPSLTPKDIYDIADGKREGNKEAAILSFNRLGHAVGDAIVHALDIVDGIVVIGGGVAGAAKYIMPGVMEEVGSNVETLDGSSFSCLQSTVFNLTDEEGMKQFLQDESKKVNVPSSATQVDYTLHRKVGVAVSTIGTSKAISLGAYAFALNQLDKA